MNSMRAAVFEHPSNARRALIELRRCQLWRPGIRILVRSEKAQHAELPLEFTDGRRAILRGVFIGGLAGLAASALIWMLGPRWFQVDVALIVFCGFLGFVFGAFTGALIGPMNPHPEFDRLEKSGRIVVTVDSDNEGDVLEAERILRKYSQRIEEPSIGHGPTSHRPQPSHHPA